jgi:CBS domain-containing protein
MSAPLLTIAPEQPAVEALLEMTRRNLHHLAVVDGERLVGVVSSHDLMLLQGAHPVALAREIEVQPTVAGLVALAAQTPALIRRLADEGVRALELGRIVAELNDRLVRRVVALAEAAVEAEGGGRPPVPYTWLAAGSEGRREQTLRTDQDNGLVYADPPAEGTGAAAAYFRRLAEVAGAALVEIGFPRCEGGFMASNPQWCRPLASWRDVFRGWLENPQPERVLQASIYCDLRPVAGDEAPGRALWQWVCAEAPSRQLFLRHMARSAAEWQPPLGLFGRLAVERSGPFEGTLDLKGRGLFPMTQAMRVYALSLGIPETNTIERLVRAGGRGAFSPAEVEELREAYETVFRVRLRHQLRQLETGTPPDNRLVPRELGKADQVLLREAFKSIGWLQRMLADRFQTAVMG